jgi:diacylglycerol kinase
MHRYLKSLGYALEGLIHAFLTERNLKIFVALYGLSLLISWTLHIHVRDWEMVILSGGLFIAVELVNTALERFADAFYTHAKAQDDLHTHAIKATKDIAAGASLVCLVGWIVVLIMIYSPHVYLLWMGG